LMPALLMIIELSFIVISPMLLLPIMSLSRTSKKMSSPRYLTSIVQIWFYHFGCLPPSLQTMLFQFKSLH
jgi:hypothetical protein